MITSVWLPQFALRVLAHGRCDGAEPIAICSRLETHPVVLDCNRPARDQGVQRGMLVSRALGCCFDLRVLEHDDEIVEAAYERFLARLEALGAEVEPVVPGRALFDARPLYRLYGGAKSDPEARRCVVEAIFAAFPKADQLRIGMAPARFVSEIAARQARARGCVTIAADQVREQLSKLPLTLLPVDARTLELWQALGLRTMVDLTGIERMHIADRFGETGVWLWQLAHGIDTRRVVPRVHMETVEEELHFPDPVGNFLMLQRAVRVLTERALGRPVFIHYAPRSVRVVAWLVSGNSWQSHRVLRTPTTDIERIALTAVAHLEQIPAPVERLCLRFDQYALRGGDQRELLPDVNERRQHMQHGVRHVQSTLNEEAVLSIVELAPDSRIPEHRAVLVPADPGEART